MDISVCTVINTIYTQVYVCAGINTLFMRVCAGISTLCMRESVRASMIQCVRVGINTLTRECARFKYTLYASMIQCVRVGINTLTRVCAGTNTECARGDSILTAR